MHSLGTTLEVSLYKICFSTEDTEEICVQFSQGVEKDKSKCGCLGSGLDFY